MISIYKYIYRNLLFYKKQHLNLVLGIALSTAILTGALIIGDSVKMSLLQMVSSRLGSAEFAISSQERFFETRLATDAGTYFQSLSAPVLMLKGNSSVSETNAKAANINILGVDSLFFRMGNTTIFIDSLAENELIINQQLAKKLNLKIDDALVLRIQKISFIPLNAPFVPDDENFISRRFVVKQIITEKQFGNFSLLNNQTSPENVFMKMESLQKMMEIGNQINLILLNGNESFSSQQIHHQIKHFWKLEDMGLSFRAIPERQQVELQSKRIFIDDTTIKRILQIEPTAKPIFTYLINSFRLKTLNTPYSFASSIGQELDSSLKNNEIIINRWMADDLKAEIGNYIYLTYYKTGALRKLIEYTDSFRIKSIVELKDAAADRFLMPEFDGLANVDRCSDWETGIPVDFKKIRDKDEAYWKNFRGTPKAFITFAKAKELWSNEYGSCTAIRFPESLDKSAFAKKMLESFTPSETSMNVYSLKKEGITAAGSGVDFAGLFIGLSFFLLIGSLILTGLLFSIHTASRAKEQGILASLGFSRTKIIQLFLYEMLVVMLVGLIVGTLISMVFNQLILLSLNSIWNEIVRTSSIHIFIKPTTLITGNLISLFLALGVMFLVIRKKMRFSINHLQRNLNSSLVLKKKHNVSFAIALICLIGLGILLLKISLEKGNQNSTEFFILGALMLGTFISFFHLILSRIAGIQFVHPSIFNVSIRNLASKRRRNTSIISLLAIGTFIVISTGLNRIDFNKQNDERTSGTGGFLFFAETDFPILHNLNTKEGRQKNNLPDSLSNVSFVQIRTLSGDDASCLNLNKVKNPQIAGIDVNEFSKRKAFSFAETLYKSENSWNVLNKNEGKTIFPAIADQTVIQWGIQRKLGDTLFYVNEKGDSIGLKLVAALNSSIFQGKILISEEHFLVNFPSSSGSKMLLVDAPVKDSANLKQTLTVSLENLGLSLSYSSDRLAMFNSVTNTYLDIFMALGGIGMILGTIGLAILILQNITDRKRETAMMLAFGIQPKQIKQLLVYENLILLSVGTFIGACSAFVAVFPSLSMTNSPIIFALVLLFIMFANGFFWIQFISAKALKNKILKNLRNE